MVPYSSVRFYAIMHSMGLSSHPTFRKEIGSVSKDECALVKMYIKEGSLQSLGTPSQLLSTEMAVSCCVCCFRRDWYPDGPLRPILSGGQDSHFPQVCGRISQNVTQVRV
ncbi:hypothetical protein ATANTOWER_018715 [Ataeniobius toweri]|uniref:Uncharacterized protein n=1 Tax=Ataeniobius toweri TaxID=208326 RepID=A0ABU7A223_9TELE|nr:hypothetical protein [Ataeniobius toweri]